MIAWSEVVNGAAVFILINTPVSIIRGLYHYRQHREQERTIDIGFRAVMRQIANLESLVLITAASRQKENAMTRITIPSTNYLRGRNGKRINKIVCHWMAGTLVGTDAVFRRANGQVSAHYGIGRDGTLHQYVDENDTAYHASNFTVNLESIGIEHEGGPNVAITDAAYETSAALIRTLCERHNLPKERATLHKHNEYKVTQCPGTLDLDRLARQAFPPVIHPTIPATNEEPNVNNEEIYKAIYKAIYISWFTDWPKEEQMRQYQELANQGLQPYTVAQRIFIEPAQAEMRQLKSENEQLRQQLEALKAQADKKYERVTDTLFRLVQ